MFTTHKHRAFRISAVLSLFDSESRLMTNIIAYATTAGHH